MKKKNKNNKLKKIVPPIPRPKCIGTTIIEHGLLGVCEFRKNRGDL